MDLTAISISDEPDYSTVIDLMAGGRFLNIATKILEEAMAKPNAITP